MGSVSPQQAAALVSSGCVTKHHRRAGRGTHTPEFTVPRPGGWGSEVQARTGLVSWACRRHPLPVSSCGRPSVHVCVLLSSSYEERQSDRIRAPPPSPYFTLISSVKTPSPNTVNSEVLGVGASTDDIDDVAPDNLGDRIRTHMS